MNPNPRSDIVIKGSTPDGRPFRPGDWAERIACVLSTFGSDCRLCYSPYVKPITYNGVRSVLIDKRLWEADPRAYDFLLNFARENQLQLIEDAGTSAGTRQPDG